jgi:hypothetical protein
MCRKLRKRKTIETFTLNKPIINREVLYSLVSGGLIRQDIDLQAEILDKKFEFGIEEKITRFKFFTPENFRIAAKFCFCSEK